MNATVASNPQLIDQIYGFAVEVTATGGTAAGSVQVQGSLTDVDVYAANAGNISTWSNISSAITISAAGSQIVNFDAQYYKWFRVRFTNSTGAVTDLLTVKYGAKGP